MTDAGKQSPWWHRSPLTQIMLTRLREFFRNWAAVFWVYGFPIIMVVALGIAFRQKPVEYVTLDICEAPSAEKIKASLLANQQEDGPRFKVQVNDYATCVRRLRTGRTDLIVEHSESATGPRYQYTLHTSRAESRLARAAVHESLQHAAGRTDAIPALKDQDLTAPGSRYVDFLVPGLLGMSLMGGGLWGVGFVIVDMRVRKLFKRFIATPMRRSDFLMGILISRLVFMVPEVLVLLLFSWIFFGFVIFGNLLTVLVLVMAGAFCFAGVGLLTASRAQTIETVSGLMNAVMLPMWLLSGIFFSAERFPAFLQPLIQALPLTPLIEGLRAVMLEGESLQQQVWRLAILMAWGLLTFFAALKWFRWN
jgi:ABC-type multidrug transport system permease subunit